MPVAVATEAVVGCQHDWAVADDIVVVAAAVVKPSDPEAQSRKMLLL